MISAKYKTKTALRPGELAANSKRIAFYICLFFHEKPEEGIRDSMDSEFEADESGRCFIKPVYGNLVELKTDDLAGYAWTRRARGYVFLRKANAEERLGVRFSK